jgi:serine/threonine protein phosphatase 1
MRTFAIGDIHGAHKALVQCLQRAGFDYEHDRLISIGDVADGWSEVPECVEELLKIKNLIPLRGNHDAWCWNWFKYGERPAMWITQGGEATVKAYLSSDKKLDPVHRNFWENQLDFFIDEENRLFVHAGFDLDVGFELSKQRNLQVRNSSELQWTRDLAELKPVNIPVNHRDQIRQFKEIFIGHTYHNDHHFNKHNIWNIDTGAGWDGVLTIMNVETKEYFQSDNVTVLYPRERGRR